MRNRGERAGFFLHHGYSNVFKLISVSAAVFLFVVLPISTYVLCKAKEYIDIRLYENVWSVASNRYLISLSKTLDFFALFIRLSCKVTLLWCQEAAVPLASLSVFHTSIKPNTHIRYGVF